jgi:hypothetical protein
MRASCWQTVEPSRQPVLYSFFYTLPASTDPSARYYLGQVRCSLMLCW